MKKLEIDKAEVRELAALMEEAGLTELEISDRNLKLRLSRGGVAVAAPVASAPAAAKPEAPVIEAAAEAAQDTAVDHPGLVKAPMVGTVYLQPEPSAPTFVSEGGTVREGDTLLIIEAMKVMNQIKAPRSGTVSRVLVTDAQPIEFGEPLVIIE